MAGRPRKVTNEQPRRPEPPDFDPDPEYDDSLEDVLDMGEGEYTEEEDDAGQEERDDQGDDSGDVDEPGSPDGGAPPVGVEENWVDLIYDEHGNVRPFRLAKAKQISCPSCEPILQLIERSYTRMAARTTFNGRKVTKQIYVNCLILGLKELGRELEDRVYDCGAAILRAAERAGEIEARPAEIRHQIWIEGQEAQTERDARAERDARTERSREQSQGRGPQFKGIQKNEPQAPKLPVQSAPRPTVIAEPSPFAAPRQYQGEARDPRTGKALPPVRKAKRPG